MAGQQEPHRVLAVGESTFEYSQTLRNQLDAEASGPHTDIVASGLQTREEALDLRANQNITEPLADAPGYHIEHEVDATRLEEKFEPNSLDRVIWNNPEAPDTEAAINGLLQSAPNVLRPGGEVHVGITGSPAAKGGNLLRNYATARSVTIGGHRYDVERVGYKDYPYGVRYPSRKTTGSQLRGQHLSSRGPKQYFIFKLVN